ncbi:MAG: histidine phosphatase family protein [Pyrinomonadaceae bacterium]
MDYARKCPHHEVLRPIIARIQTALEQWLIVHPNGEIALIAHGGVCRAIIGRALEIPMRNWLRLAQDYGCMNVIDWYGASPVLQQLNLRL